ncbi:Hypothetical predicted protein [Paramuricea clavata]|uniref:Up-regulator of cell proliferation-like domain-containing protein n=2 Tax=Paramuricea clavata TaxID=317549 RepID=A0A6S7J329_PARCT|nr:Hypothetical predicted protein [Paramuricea clavata]
MEITEDEDQQNGKKEPTSTKADETKVTETQLVEETDPNLKYVKPDNSEDSEERGNSEKPVAGKPDAEKPDDENPVAGKPDGEKLNAEKLDAEKPDGERPDGEKPDGEKLADTKKPNGKTKNDSDDGASSVKPDAGKSDENLPNDPKNVKPENPSGRECLGEHSLPESKRGNGEPERKDQSSEALKTSTTCNITHTHTHTHTHTQDKNFSTYITGSKSWTDLSTQPTSAYTLTRARTVDNHTLTDDELTSADQVPDYILKTLMIVNYHAREFKLKPSTSEVDENNYDSDKDDDDDDKDVEGGVNPMDGLLWIFHCSDDFLRRDLAIQLSECQLGVPFLLPDPAAPSENVTILLSALERITKSWKDGSDEKDGASQVFATEHPFPLVSFIRVGKPTMSKSSLMP